MCLKSSVFKCMENLVFPKWLISAEKMYDERETGAMGELFRGMREREREYRGWGKAGLFGRRFE